MSKVQSTSDTFRNHLTLTLTLTFNFDVAKFIDPRFSVSFLAIKFILYSCS